MVPEENTTDHSTPSDPPTNDQWADIIQPDQSYPNSYDKPVPTVQPKNFFSPITIKSAAMARNTDNNMYHQVAPDTNTNTTSVYGKKTPENTSNLYTNTDNGANFSNHTIATEDKNGTDLLVKTDNHDFSDSIRSTFSNGGNLEELLKDIETISRDILKITDDQQKPYKSELNVVLMPNPMPLLGFEKYKNVGSFDGLHQIDEKTPEIPVVSNQITPIMNEILPIPVLPPINSTQSQTIEIPVVPTPAIGDNSFFFHHHHQDSGTNSSDYFNARYNPDNFTKKPENGGSKTNLLELTSSDVISSENEENLKFNTSKTVQPTEKTEKPNEKSPKLGMIRRKVSIHFKGKKEKRSDSKAEVKKTPSIESKKSTTDVVDIATTSSSEKKQRRSVSPDKKHVHVKEDKKKKKHRRGKNRKTSSVDRLHRERSFSVCTDRSNILDHRLAGVYYDDSERERTNSMSSCDTVKTRKMSSISNIHLNGKVPWCACWGNGCI